MTALEYGELVKSLGQMRIALDSLTQRIVNLERRWTEHMVNEAENMTVLTDSVSSTPLPLWVL